MNTPQWSPAAADILAVGPVVPVLVIHEPEHAIPIAEALMAGGIRTLEVTMRTPKALAVIETLARNCPDAVVGAGTVSNPSQLQSAVDAGSSFMISPGLTTSLLDAACHQSVPLIPGISTLSELMTGMDYGLDCFKFFPAAAAGGIPMLKAIAGPYPEVSFCPTGGINPDNAADYLALPNVRCVGGSWLVPGSAVSEGDWQQITRLSQEILARLGAG